MFFEIAEFSEESNEHDREHTTLGFRTKFSHNSTYSWFASLWTWLYLNGRQFIQMEIEITFLRSE